MKSRRHLITALLVFACILSGSILATTDAPPKQRLLSVDILDTVIQDAFKNHQISRNQYRTRTISVDTLFSRKIYRVGVPSSFSKTSFHLALHQELLAHDVHTPAKIVFPEHTMNIFLTYNGTVHRTIELINREPEIIGEQ